MLRVFFKNRGFDPDMLIRVMLIKKKACIQQNRCDAINISFDVTVPHT